MGRVWELLKAAGRRKGLLAASAGFWQSLEVRGCPGDLNHESKASGTKRNDISFNFPYSILFVLYR